MLADVKLAYDLPPFPPQYDGDDARVLFLAVQGRGRVDLCNGVSPADAKAYCSREDTHGTGWFVGFDLA
jgi:hypothetical protein